MADKPNFGFSEYRTDHLVEAREKVYVELFGSRHTVSHELLPLVPHIDVYIFEPGQRDRDFYTFVTGGMSDQPMSVPAGQLPRRAELILYARDPNREYVGLLRWLARIPHDQGSYYKSGTTMNNGQPAQPLFAKSKLDHLLFMQSIISPDNTLPELLSLDGDATELLWVLPITAQECGFIHKSGIGDFLDVLQEKQHPVVLDPARKSYVR